MKTIILAALLLIPTNLHAQEYIMTSKASIEDYIMSRAIAYNYRPDKAVAIATAESGLKIDAKNASSTASGLFQFINGTFKAFCIDGYKLADNLSQKNDPFIQIECATKMLSQGGEHHWVESKGVWGKIK